MAWRHTSTMYQKTQFIVDDLRDRLSVTELCAPYGVSRNTGDRWVDRYLICSPQGLEKRSRRPSTSPRHTPDDGVAAILDAPRRHPSWDEPSLRKMPHKLPPIESPDRSAVRDVSANGGIRWHHQWVNASHVCVGAYVGLEEMDDGIWHVDFGPRTLGRLLERHRRIEDAYGRLKRPR